MSKTDRREGHIMGLRFADFLQAPPASTRHASDASKLWRVFCESPAKASVERWPHRMRLVGLIFFKKSLTIACTVCYSIAKQRGEVQGLPPDGSTEMKPNALNAMVDSYNTEYVYREMANETNSNDEWNRLIRLANEEADKQMTMALVIAEYEGITVNDVLNTVIDEWEKGRE